MIAIIHHPLVSRKRSAAKAVTWRMFAAVDTFAVSYLITGSIGWAGSIVGVEAISKMVFYYLHERAWVHVAWGTPVAPAV